MRSERDDLGRERRHSGHRYLIWSVLGQPEVRTILVMVLEVGTYQSEEMALAENHDRALDLRIDSRPSWATVSLPYLCPVALETFAVPLRDRIRVNDDQATRLALRELGHRSVEVVCGPPSVIPFLRPNEFHYDIE